MFDKLVGGNGEGRDSAGHDHIHLQIRLALDSGRNWYQVGYDISDPTTGLLIEMGVDPDVLIADRADTFIEACRTLEAVAWGYLTPFPVVNETRATGDSDGPASESDPDKLEISDFG